MWRGYYSAIGLTVLLAAGAARLLDPADPAAKEQAERVAQLIGQLGHADFDERDEAFDELRELGEPILPALREAAVKSDDFEIRWRARQLVSPSTRKSPSLGLELVLIKSGEFNQGSSASEPNRKLDEEQHRVRISEPFYLGVYEVTQHEFERVMETNPSWFSAKGGGNGKVVGKPTGRYPVESVSWFDAIEFCNRLSEQDKLPQFYKLTGLQREGSSIKSAKVSIVGGFGYRLPTEAEWEYACRANTTLPYHYGGDSNARMANTKGVSVSGGYGGVVPAIDLARTNDVGSYKPNEWGLFDMHGNASEWCWDWYDKDYYRDSPKTDPPGPKEGNQRVLRGGSWMVNEGSCRSASRFWLTPDERKEYAGFRVARTP